MILPIWTAIPSHSDPPSNPNPQARQVRAFYAMTTPTKPAGFALSNPVPPTKWEATRAAERISLEDHKEVPHRNSTTSGPNNPKELEYRGRGR